MKDNRRAVEGITGDFSRLALAAGLAGASFSIFSQVTSKLFDVAKVSPDVAIATQNMSLAFMQMGLEAGPAVGEMLDNFTGWVEKITPIVGPILEKVSDTLTFIGETVVEPVIDILVSMDTTGLSSTLGASAVTGVMTYIFTRGNVPLTLAAITIPIGIDLFTNWENMDPMERVILSTLFGAGAGALAGSIIPGVGTLAGGALGALLGFGFSTGYGIGEGIEENTGRVS